MQKESFDSIRENSILIGMITDPVVCAAISSQWTEDSFRQKEANTIARIILKYYRKYLEPPRDKIKTLFAVWANKRESNPYVIQIERVISNLSSIYESMETPCNSSYLIDQAGEIFNETKLGRLADNISKSLTNKNLKEALEEYTNFTQVRLGEQTWYDPFSDEESIHEAFDNIEANLLVTYPGQANNFFGDSLSRDEFIAIQAISKAGKSYILLDIAFRALLQKRSVGFFEVGDLTKSQATRRISCRASRHPWISTNSDRSWPCKIKLPKTLRVIDNKPFPKCEVTYDYEEYTQPLDSEIAKLAMKRLITRKIKTNKLRVSTHASGSINAEGIRSILKLWTLEGFTPDIVIVDYSDLLSPPPRGSKLSSRDQSNENWKSLRRLNQEYHNLLITATQADAKAYDQWGMSRSNFSEDRRKNDHVTGMIGVCCTEEEKRLGVRRLCWLHRREADTTALRWCWWAGCLSIANPCLISLFP